MNQEQSDQLAPDRLRFTGSEMKMWQRCRRKWYLSTYLRYGKREPEWGKPTGIGTRVHSALQTIYDPERQDADVLKEMRDSINSDLERYPNSEKEIRKEGELSLIMVEGYLDWLEETGADSDLELLATERGVEVAIPGFDPNVATLLAKLDARVQYRHDNSRWALEHKTVPDLSTPLPLLQIDFQLLTEHLVEYLDLLEAGVDADSEVAEGVLYNMLRKVKRTAAAKPPFFKREPVRHNKNELISHWRHVTSIVTDIMYARTRLDGGETHHTVTPPNSHRDCKWDCPFFAVCGLLDDGSDYESALDDLYEKRDPLERYNQDLNTKEEQQ